MQVAPQLQSAQRELAPLRRHQGPDASDRLQESSPVNGPGASRTAGNSRGSAGDRRGLGPGLRGDAQAHQAAVGQEEHRLDRGVAQVANQVPARTDRGRAQTLQGEERVVGPATGCRTDFTLSARGRTATSAGSGRSTPNVDALGVERPSELGHRLAAASAEARAVRTSGRPAHRVPKRPIPPRRAAHHAAPTC